RVEVRKEFEALQVTTTSGTIGGGRANYPVNGPYYQDLSAFIPTFNRNLPIAYRWRCMECGQRTIDTVTNMYRLLIGLEGVIAGHWDYRVAASTSRSKADSELLHGYMYTT